MLDWDSIAILMMWTVSKFLTGPCGWDSYFDHALKDFGGSSKA